MRCGIEFEYLILDLAGEAPGRIRDFTNLTFDEIRPPLEDKPGRGDPTLAEGDLGIRSGYWYLEGDERFHPDGSFRTLIVKGIEIRTPIELDIAAAVQSLVRIEATLSETLARHGLGVGIVAFNPIVAHYAFEPPLNAWEQAERARDRSYDGTHVSTLSYGPDINLSMPGWNPEQTLDAARKLNAYAPFMVPFSFNSPFHGRRIWNGPSKRTFERAALRPAVKVYVAPEPFREGKGRSSLIYPARAPLESGRIEFKAFDAMPSLDLLIACSLLLEGVCLTPGLTARSDGIDLDLYRNAALGGFEDARIREGSMAVLDLARRALIRAGRDSDAVRLEPLAEYLGRKRTPAHDLVDWYRHTGVMLQPHGLVHPSA